MALYELGLSKTTGAAAGPITTLVGSSTRRVNIREIGIWVSTAVSGTVGIGRPAAVGSGAVTGGTVQALDDTSGAGAAQVASSFATSQPTAPTNFMRRFVIPGVIGAGMVWVWGPDELWIPVSGNLVLWQLTALAVTYETYWKVYE